MRNEMRLLSYLGIVFLTLNTDLSGASGNVALGISQFQVLDTASASSVIGRDAEGREVARLDLIHGRFALTGPFKADYSSPEVTGRKLDVSIRGEKRLIWETAGFEPTLHMPAHPASESALALLLEDRHVKPILRRWGIGFKTAAAPARQSSANVGEIAGTFVQGCSGLTTCGTTRGLTINTCGAGAPALIANRVTAFSTPNEDTVAQCCPAGSGGQTVNWFAIKTCPTSGTVSSCGTVGSGACKACPGYPAPASQFCGMAWSASDASLSYCHDNTTGQTLTLEVVANGTGGSVVVDDPYGFPVSTLPDGTHTMNRCTGGTVVLTVANPYPDDWFFLGWSGACTGADATCNVAMDAAKNVAATFSCKKKEKKDKKGKIDCLDVTVRG